MWDELLSAGIRIFAVAVDDAHTFRQEFTIEQASPGRCSVAARATALTRQDILTALNRGDVYASSGVELVNVVSTIDSLAILYLQEAILVPLSPDFSLTGEETFREKPPKACT